MSEQPIQYSNVSPNQEGTVFRTSIEVPEYQIDLHSNTVPKYDSDVVDQGRSVFEKSTETVEVPRLSEAAVIGARLERLHLVRDQYKLLEQTDFLKSNDLEEAA